MGFHFQSETVNQHIVNLDANEGFVVFWTYMFYWWFHFENENLVN